MKPILPKSQRSPREKLVFVEWVDSCGTDGWQTPSSLDLTGKTCFSVGWMLKDNNESLSLASSCGMNSDDSFDQVHGHMTIPRVAILRAKTLSSKRM